MDRVEEIRNELNEVKGDWIQSGSSVMANLGGFWTKVCQCAAGMSMNRHARFIANSQKYIEDLLEEIDRLKKK